MSHDQENRPEADRAATPEDHSPETESAAKGRRQFIKKAIVTAPVILTVTSQPVWAAWTSRRCTISGDMSGNLSGHEEEDCGEGCTPGFWKKATWPDGDDNLKNKPYGDFFDVESTLNWKGSGQDFTLFQCVLKDPPVSSEEMLAFHAVAAYLNALHPGIDYVYTPNQVIFYVQQAYNNMYSFEYVKDNFDYLNNRGCPLSHNWR